MREGPSGKRFDDQWREIPDDTPISVPVNLRPKSMEQMVATYVAQAMALQARMNGEESSDEAEDLEVDEEGEAEILTPYELHALAAEAEREARRKAWLLEQMRGGKKPPAKPAAGASGPLVDQGGQGTVDLVKGGNKDDGNRAGGNGVDAVTGSGVDVGKVSQKDV